MRRLSNDLVIQALRSPHFLDSLSLSEWDLLVRQARSADLVARLACQLEDRGALISVPDGPQWHFRAERLLAIAQHTEVVREVDAITRALSQHPGSIILLKGAGYSLGGLPAGLGRLFSDIDILVPKARISDVEATLIAAGWGTTHHSAYDQYYYRKWMHELPPMQHLHRGTVLDVHHSILPETSRQKPDSAKLIANSVELNAGGRLQVLAPTDMVLHSMTHLFHNEEFTHGLRDLSDLDLLLRHFGTQEVFWRDLARRAVELDLGRILHYGLTYTAGILGTPVDREVADTARRYGPGKCLQALMDSLWSRALCSPHASTKDRWTGIAMFLLYLRAHWLRMPVPLLVVHLTVKAVMRLKKEPTTDEQ